MTPDHGELIAAAQAGDAQALEALLTDVRDGVYRLALRMVTRPADAEDATQEILIRVMTRLSAFRGDAAFTTWVHRVAVNHLLDRRKSCAERAELTFDLFADDLLDGLATSPSDHPDAEILAQEVRLACTQALLTCLDRPHRIAYILGEIVGTSSEEGAYICDISPAAYRKRLSRARQHIRRFLQGSCGIVNPEGARCRCAGRVDTAISLGRLDPDALEYRSHPAEAATAEVVALSDAADLIRSHPAYTAPPAVADRIAGLLQTSTHLALSQP